MQKGWQTGDGESDWGMISRGNKKRFGKEVKQVRKVELARDEMVNDNNGQILSDGVEVRRRWAECFEQVLNVECGRCQGDKYQCSRNLRIPMLEI